MVLAFALLLIPLASHSQSDNEKETNSTQSPPPVALDTPKPPAKDGYDKAAFWVNVSLAAVGMGGIGVAVCTLGFIRKQTGEMRLQRIAMHNTLNSIRRQADLMEKQAGHMEVQTDILRGSVAVAKKSADAAKASVDTMIAKERARIEINSGTLTLDNETRFWNLKTTVKFRNMGNSRAYITKTASEFYIGPPGDVVPREAEYGFLIFEDGIIDAGKEPAEQTICFFPKDGEFELAEFSQRFYNSQLKAYIFGFIEYETMGTTWHRDFRYEWATSQEGIFFNLFGCAHPTTNEGRITSGHWRQSYSSNVEYLIPDNPEEESKPN